MKYILFPLLPLLSLIAQGVAVALPAREEISDSPSYGANGDYQKTVLWVHNRYRAEHNAAGLKWDNKLADTALKWAKRCEWKHSGSGPGENLAMGYPTVSKAIAAWGDERKLYDFRKPTGFSEKTGHFTQMVWRDTKTVGCARIKCGADTSAHGWYDVCEYSPPGNVIGDDRFKSNVQHGNGGNGK